MSLTPLRVAVFSRTDLEELAGDVFRAVPCADPAGFEAALAAAHCGLVVETDGPLFAGTEPPPSFLLQRGWTPILLLAGIRARFEAPRGLPGVHESIHADETRSLLRPTLLRHALRTRVAEEISRLACIGPRLKRVLIETAYRSPPPASIKSALRSVPATRRSLNREFRSLACALSSII